MASIFLVTGHWSLITLALGEPAPTVCRYPVSGTVSLPSSGCFSPFPHGTCSLSVAEEYLGLEGGPPVFRQDCTCPALLESLATRRSIRGCHPLRPGFPAGSGISKQKHWPDPRSLATTNGVSLMSFPPGTEMFQFPGFALIPLFYSENKSLLLISVGPKTAPSRLPRSRGSSGMQPARKPLEAQPVRPRLEAQTRLFGATEIEGGLPHSEIFGSKPVRGSPMTYRSVPRPSSPLSAKASTRYP